MKSSIRQGRQEVPSPVSGRRFSCHWTYERSNSKCPLSSFIGGQVLMEQFDYLITNGTIVTMQSREQVLKGASLGITGDRISFLGDSKNLPTPDAKKVVDAKGGLVLPGLVNGHTHAAMTLFRGLADDLPLMEWLTKYIFPVEKRMDTAFVRTG